MIFKQETIKSWFTGVGSSINNEVVQPFKNANSIISKYNLAIQHNSLTQQGWQRLLAQSDDSLKAYLTSIKGTTASMAGYNVSLQGNITGFTKITKAMQQYNALGATSQKEQQAFATAVGVTNTKLSSYLTGLNGAKASLSGYGLSLIASTAKTIGLTVATTALNATLTMGISLIVSGLISAFVSWIHKSEEITEKAQEAADKINSINDSLKSNTETVENAKKRYAELAQEVKNLGKITQSQGTLSNEEYEEFLDLSNQLAGIFPSLTKNYDENGNAILDLSGDVNTIVGSLDSLIQKEKELANQKIMEEFPDVFKGWNQDLSDAEQKVKSAKTEFDNINQAYNALGKGQSIQMGFNVNGSNVDSNGNITTMGQYISWLETLGLTYEEMSVQGGHVVTAVGDIDVAFTSKLEEARENLQYAQQQLEGQTSSINQYLNTWLQGEFSYIQIEDSGLQTAIQDVLFNFDWDNIPEDKRGDWNYVSEYLRRNILFEINKVQDDPIISKAISEIFTNTELTPDEKTNYLQQIKDFFGEGSAVVISLKPQIEETETLQKQYDKAIEDTKKKFDGYDPTAFFKEQSINTQEEIDKWQEIAQGARDAAEAEREYIQGSTLNIFPISLSISQTVDQLNTQLKPSFDALKSAYNDIFTDDGEFALNSIDILSTCDSIKSKLDELNETEGITVDFSAYEDFVRVLSDTESTEQDVEDAFDSLATSISRATLSGAEDFETMKAALEDLGVVNNELVAFSALVSNTEALKEAFDQANVSMDDFIVNTENGSVEATQAGRAFLEEKVGAENCTEALSILALHKELCNLQEMNTGKEVANLRTLAENAGYTGDVIKYLTELERIYQEVASGTLTPAQIGIKLGKAAILKNMIDNAASKIQYAPKVDWSGAVKGAAKAGKAAGKSYADSAKSALDSFKEALDNFMDAQEKALDAGKITFQEYCNTVSTYIREAYDSGKISAKDFWDYQGRFLEKQKSIYDKVVRAVTRKIDDELDKLKDKQDEIDKFYDSQISSLEKTKKLLQETNDERKRQTDLQKALYDMERAYNQRTVLQYSDEKGMHYVSDPKAIRDARENVASTRLEIQIAEIDKSISRLEELRDKEKSALEDIIEKLEDYKEKWNDVTSAYEEAQEDQLAAMILGQGWEADILSMRTETLTNFANDYIRIQQAIADAAWESANAQIAAQQAAMSAISNPSSTVPDKKETSDAKSPIKYKTKKYKDTPNTIAVGIKAGASHLANVFSNLKFHTGLRQGLVGSHSFDDDFKLVQSVGLKENEVPAILKKGEAVATQEQISNIADGLRQSNNSESQTVVINGTEYRPLQPGDKMYDLVQKFDAYLERINHNIDMLTPNSVYEHQRQMEDMAKQINYVSSVTNNNRNTQPVVNHINVTCPGVTSQQVAEQLGSVIGKELDKQFNGFHNYTDQMSRIR